jgi:predicted PurR-regulated permease PerM
MVVVAVVTFVVVVIVVLVVVMVVMGVAVTQQLSLSSNIRRSYSQPTPVGLINYILKHHVQHLKSVIFRTDSTVESAQMAHHILSRVRSF